MPPNRVSRTERFFGAPLALQERALCEIDRLEGQVGQTRIKTRHRVHGAGNAPLLREGDTRGHVFAERRCLRTTLEQRVVGRLAFLGKPSIHRR